MRSQIHPSLNAQRAPTRKAKVQARSLYTLSARGPVRGSPRSARSRSGPPPQGRRHADPLSGTQSLELDPVTELGVQELDRLLVDLHVLAVGDRRRLGRAHEVAPAPR